MNEILSNHNVDKQMSDSRKDVSVYEHFVRLRNANSTKIEVAYLMADISDVNTSQIKELYQSLENLSCESTIQDRIFGYADETDFDSPDNDEGLVLDSLFHISE